jgi:hypothetical protein
MDQSEFLELLRGKQLVRESRWMRVYRLDGGHLHYESKIATDGLEVKADELKREWPTYSAVEKRDFAEAYSVKPNNSGEDQEILRFLIDAGSDDVWGWLAFRLTELPERDRVLQFLIKRVEEGSDYFPNYIQALEVLADSRAIPVLEDKLGHYKAQIEKLKTPLNDESFVTCLRYLCCCRALIELAGSSAAQAGLNSMQDFPDERVQAIARRMRSDKEY